MDIWKTYTITGTDGISEIKIETGADYCIYFNVFIQGNEVLFLIGGSKSA
jgi:putative component of toxin-antitoxin plasmid stabilization module